MAAKRMGLNIPDVASSSTAPAHILVVDDEPTIRALIAEALEDEGHVVETAGDGLDAVEAVGRRMPDAIVLDLLMPGMSGPEVLRWLREHALRIPTLVISASLDGPVIASADGADVYMYKPFDLDRLCEQVQYLVSLAEAGRLPAVPEMRWANARPNERPGRP